MRDKILEKKQVIRYRKEDESFESHYHDSPFACFVMLATPQAQAGFEVLLLLLQEALSVSCKMA